MNGLVLIMAGGTGGHVFPALAVADELRRRGVKVAWLGTTTGLEARVVPAANIPFHTLQVRGLRGKGMRSWLMAPLQLLRALHQAYTQVRALNPRAVLGMGGYTAGPGGVSTWLLRRPLIIHEQNAIPGLTNRLLSRIARRVLVAFPGALPTPPAEVVGNPVRAEIAAMPAPEARFADRQGPLRLLVLGGSLGALVLNQVVPKALARLADIECSVWHQTGKQGYEEAQTAYQAQLREVRVMPFIEDMASAYVWADLVICRAGALTIAELALVGLGAVLVPYPHAVDDHQTHNARYLVEHQAAILLPQTELSEERLAALLADLLRDRARLQTMAMAARSLAQPHATQAVVEALLTEGGMA